MTAFRTLLWREWLEARVPFFWLPLGLLAFLMVISLIALLLGGGGDFELVMTGEGGVPNLMFINEWSDQEFEQRMGLFRRVSAAPFYLVYLFAALFVLLGALYDERKDRSVLFWKSMPVTDYQTVASKLAVAIWIAPLVMVVFIVLAQIYGLLLATGIVWTLDLGDAGQLWSHAGLLRGTFMLLLGVLIQGLWTLPVTGYLLLISATVPRLTLLWAMVVPVLAGLTEGILFRTRFISQGIARHMEGAALPIFANDDSRIMPVVSTIGEQLALLVNPDLWLGVLFGLVFLYGAVRMRGLNNEL